MEAWPERDEVLSEDDKDAVINWSDQHGVLWPGCNRKFWILLFYARLRINPNNLIARKFLSDRSCEPLPDGSLRTPLGVVRLHQNLKL